MKAKLITLAAVTAVFASVSTPVLADQALATSKNCMACHAVAQKMVGPSFKDVAGKYTAADTAKLAATIQKGSAPGKGNWGPVPMPANTQVSDADATKLATWVLSLK